MFGRDPEGREALLAIGEAKWNETVGVHHLQRLTHIRTLLQNRPNVHAGQCRLILFSGTGFTDDLHRTAAADADVVLVDPARLYSA